MLFPDMSYKQDTLSYFILATAVNVCLYRCCLVSAIYFYTFNVSCFDGPLGWKNTNTLVNIITSKMPIMLMEGERTESMLNT